MSQSSDILLALLRQALGTSDGCQVDLECVSNEEWNQIIDLSFDQGVDAISVDGYNASLGNGECLLESEELEDLRLDWFGSVLQAEADNREHAKMIEFLAKTLAENNQQLLLLKGFGLSQNYPIPEHRTLGDIDIYQGEKGDETFRARGLKVMAEYHKHSTFVKGGITVENHLKFLDDVKHKSNRRFEEILERLNESQEYLKEELTVGSQKVLLPNATFNALFLLRHSGEHFAAHEMTIRQVLDLGLFYRSHGQAIDWPFVMKVLEEEGMRGFYDVVGTICVEWLGMDDEDFVDLRRNRLLAEKVLEDMFTGARCEGEVPERKSLLRYGVFMTKRWWRNRWKYKMVYRESLWESFLGLAVNRVKGDNIKL